MAGVMITRASPVPEITVTADPVAATDEDALVARQIERLTPRLDGISHAFAERWARAASAAQLFLCA